MKGETSGAVPDLEPGDLVMFGTPSGWIPASWENVLLIFVGQASGNKPNVFVDPTGRIHNLSELYRDAVDWYGLRVISRASEALG